jgi:hypothetical protein
MRRMNKPGPALLVLLFSASAWAQDQQVGARTKAMGGSYTAFEDDPVSVWLNPAGIATQPDGASIAYQTYTIYEFEVAPSGMGISGARGEAAWNDPAIVPSYLGVVFQLGEEGNQTVGFCFTTPFRNKFFWDSIQGTPTPIPLIEDQVFYRLRAAYARDFRLSQQGFLTHVSIGIGADVNVTNWTHTELKDLGGGNGSATLTISGTDMGFGGGAGILIGIYDDGESFRVNLGAAYQSKANYDFSLDFDLVPLFDWPDQYQAGLALYLFQGFPLRLTADAQLIQWKDAVHESSVPGRDDFDNALNLSVGIEFRLKVTEGTSLYPRAGLRHFDAPWDDKDNLPAVGTSLLAIDTRDDAFLVYSFGIGVGWKSEAKLRQFDVAVDVGGDAPGMAVGFSMEF